MAKYHTHEDTISQNFPPRTGLTLVFQNSNPHKNWVTLSMARTYIDSWGTIADPLGQTEKYELFFLTLMKTLRR